MIQQMTTQSIVPDDPVEGMLDMKAQGYSLVEIVVSIGILSVLLAIGTLKFKEYAKRYATESQTRRLYYGLLTARADAVFHRRPTLVKLYPNSFHVYSSQTVGADVGPVASEALRYSISVAESGKAITFDARGIASPVDSICLEPNDGAGSVDSVVINYIRVNIGKKDRGDDCNSTNITIR